MPKSSCWRNQFWSFGVSCTLSCSLGGCTILESLEDVFLKDHGSLWFVKEILKGFESDSSYFFIFYQHLPTGKESGKTIGIIIELSTFFHANVINSIQMYRHAALGSSSLQNNTGEIEKLITWNHQIRTNCVWLYTCWISGSSWTFVNPRHDWVDGKGATPKKSSPNLTSRSRVLPLSSDSWRNPSFRQLEKQLSVLLVPYSSTSSDFSDRNNLSRSYTRSPSPGTNTLHMFPLNVRAMTWSFCADSRWYMLLRMSVPHR